VGVLLLGCPADNRFRPEAIGAGTVTIKGSNTFGDEVAPSLIAAFGKEYPAVKIEVTSKDSASGFVALLAGECDIAAATRLATEEELHLAKARGIELESAFVCYYGVALVVNPANPILNLSGNQVRDVFAGIAQNWTEVGGLDAPVRIHIRGPGSATHAAFRHMALDDRAYAASATMHDSYADIVEAVRKDRDAVGFASMSLAEHSGLKALLINHYPASVLGVNEGQYPYARGMRLYTDKARQSPAAMAFIRFVQSPRGQAVIGETGFVRRFEEKLWIRAKIWD
jgi:phosphate transport system substrate-binding protein